MKSYLEILTESTQRENKLMFDLANLLDHALFQLAALKDDYQLNEVAILREEIFHDFCALCVKAGVPVPEMEETLITVHLPEVKEETIKAHKVRVKNFVESALAKLVDCCQGGKEALCRAFVQCLAGLPSLSGGYTGGSITAKQLECLINSMLIELGMQPVRPDYQSREVKSEKMSPARRGIKLLIVDDRPFDLLKTARALAGWEGLNILFYHQTSSVTQWKVKPEERQAELSKAAQAIFEVKPDIILMDGGLAVIDGHDLIPAICGLYQDDAPMFVANTGGDSEELEAVGALANCNKGKSLNGVSAAVRRF